MSTVPLGSSGSRPICLTRFGYDDVESFFDSDRVLLNLVGLPDAFEELRKRVEAGSRGVPKPLSRVISFIGSTHDGKSTMAGFILGQNPSLRPRVAEKAALEPTTANVNAYLVPSPLPNGSYGRGPLLLLDLEGDNAGNKLPKEGNPDVEFLQKNHGAPALSDTEFWDAYCGRRADSCEEHLTRLAYVTSDLVILVTKQSFANRKVKKKVIDAAMHAASEGVEDSELPSLLMISNFASEGLVDVTKDFFENHDRRRDLEKQYYRAVRCLCVPSLNFATTASPDEQKLVADTRKLLQDVVSDLLVARLKAREEKENMFDLRVWTFLAEMVLDKFHRQESLRMGQLLTQAMVEDFRLDVAFGKVTEFFYAANWEHAIETFDRARVLALFAHACFAAESLLLSGLSRETVLGRLSSSASAGTLLGEFGASLRKLIKTLDSSKPCTATSTVTSENGQSVVVSCRNTKRVHDAHTHRNPDIKVLTIAGRVRNFFRRKGAQQREPASWSGAFEAPDTPVEPLVSRTISLLRYLVARATPSTLTLARCELVRAAKFADNQPTTWPRQCCACWGQLDSAPAECGHGVCAACRKKLSRLPEIAPSVFNPSAQIAPLECHVCNSRGSWIDRDDRFPQGNVEPIADESDFAGEFQRVLPARAAPLSFNLPYSIAPLSGGDSGGEFVVGDFQLDVATDSVRRRVRTMSTSGACSGEYIFADNAKELASVASDVANGTVYVADTPGRRVHVLQAPALAPVRTFPVAFGGSLFGIAVDADRGRLYAAEKVDGGPHRVGVYDLETGAFRTALTRPRETFLPRAVQTAADGRVVVSSFDGYLMHFDANHNLTAEVAIGRPAEGNVVMPGLALDPAGTSVAVSCGNEVRLYALDGKLIRSLGGPANNAPGTFRDPQGLAFTDDGQLVVCDAGNHRLQVFA